MFANIFKSERGATVIEVAVGVPLTLLSMIIAIEFCRASYTQITMQRAAAFGVRQGILAGKTLGEIETATINAARQFGISVTTADVTVCSSDWNGSSNTLNGGVDVAYNCTVEGTGGEDDIITVWISKQLPLFGPVGGILGNHRGSVRVEGVAIGKKERLV